MTESKKQHSTRETVVARLDDCESYMLTHSNNTDVERHFEAEWGVTRRQVRNYIRSVRKRWARAAAGKSKEQRKVEAREKFQLIFDRAIASNCLNPACRAQERIIELDGLKEAEEIVVTQKGPDLSRLSVEEIRTLREIRRKLGQSSEDDDERNPHQSPR